MRPGGGCRWWPERGARHHAGAQTTRLARGAWAYAIVVPPFYYQIDQEAVRRHYRTVREVGGLPLLAYHIPGLTKAPVQPETLLALAEEGTLEGMKDSGGLRLLPAGGGRDAGYPTSPPSRGATPSSGWPLLRGRRGDQRDVPGSAAGHGGALPGRAGGGLGAGPGLAPALPAGRRRRAGWIPALKGALSALGVCAPMWPPQRPLSEERLQAQRERIPAAQAEGLFSP